MALEGSKDLIAFDGGFLIADMVSDVSADDAVDLPDHAIEDGSKITDHLVQVSPTLALTLVQTETPIFPGGTFAKRQVQLDVRNIARGRVSTKLKVQESAAPIRNISNLVGAAVTAIRGTETISVDGRTVLEAVGQPLKIEALTSDAQPNRVNAFHDQLVQLMIQATLLTVSFKGKQYPGMRLTTVSRVDTRGALGRSTFNVTMKRVPTVETQTTELPAAKPRTRKNVGAKNKDLTDEEKFRLRRSVLKSGVNLFG